MNEEEQVRLRYLPDGPHRSAEVRAVKGREIELDVDTAAADFVPGIPVEIEGIEWIYLGVAERCNNGRLWIQVEHILDRKTLSVIQSTWKESAARV